MKPFHDTSLINEGGPHGEIDAARDIDGGTMDGFVASALDGNHTYCAANPFSPDCTADTGRLGQPDVMGYHDAREIPNYWAYAEHFVLQDHMFESVRRGACRPTSPWSPGGRRPCSTPDDPMSCTTDLGKYPPGRGGTRPSARRRYAWTDITYLLHQAGVSWKYYVAEGTQPDCADDAMFCAPQPQTVGTPEIWNPLPGFEDVSQDGQLGNVQTGEQLLPRRRAGHAAERLVDRPERGRQRAPAARRSPPDRPR